MSDAKNVRAANGGHIVIKVSDQAGRLMYIKISRNLPMWKLMREYCDRTRLSISSTRFLFGGQPIAKNDTPASLYMKDYDTITVFQQQVGGYRSPPINRA